MAHPPFRRRAQYRRRRWRYARLPLAAGRRRDRVRLPAFETRDMHGAPLSDGDVLARAPALLVLLRGFA
jgi:hypothetical protein